MELRDMILLLHPTIAVLVVFPLLGIVMNKAWQTRERRLQLLWHRRCPTHDFFLGDFAGNLSR
jgi:Protein of unknown function (DUF4079)